MRRPLAVVLILAAAAVWGTAGTVQELAVPTGAPAAVGAVRCLIGGVLLAVVAAVRGARIPRPSLGPVAVTAGAMVVFQAGYLGGIRATGVAVGTLVAIGSAPVWAGLLGVVRGRRPPTGWLVATTLTVGGLALVVTPDAIAVDPWGVAAAAAAGAGYAGYVATTAQLRDGLDPFAMLAAVFLVAGAVLLAAPGGRTVGVDGPAALAGHLWLGVGTIALGYVMFVAGLGGVDAPTATTLTLAEPLTATALAVVVVGESLSGPAAFGLVALMLGLVGAARLGTAPVRLPPPRSGP